jgi:CRP/FNR family cyclic AMP-dependent transcriptional regulator
MQRIFRRRAKRPRSEAKGVILPIAEYLRRVDIFKDLTQEEIEALFKGVMLRECSPGTVFFAPEDPSERLFILKMGQVELYRLTPDGKRLVTRRIGSGTIFGEMGLLGQTLQGCFAEATEDSLVCIATRDDVIRLLKERPDVALRLLESIGNRLKLLEERLEQAVFSPVKVRLASFLLANIDPSTGIITGYTHEEIGNTIGALRQTVTETLSEMQRHGLVEVGHKLIRVIDRHALEDVALSEETVLR